MREGGKGKRDCLFFPLVGVVGVAKGGKKRSVASFFFPVSFLPLSASHARSLSRSALSLRSLTTNPYLLRVPLRRNGNVLPDSHRQSAGHKPGDAGEHERAQALGAAADAEHQRRGRHEAVVGAEDGGAEPGGAVGVVDVLLFLVVFGFGEGESVSGEVSLKKGGGRRRRIKKRPRRRFCSRFHHQLASLDLFRCFSRSLFRATRRHLPHRRPRGSLRRSKVAPGLLEQGRRPRRQATRRCPPLARHRADGEPSSPRRSHRARMRRHAGAAGASPARKDGDDSAPARTLTRVSATSLSFFLSSGFFRLWLAVAFDLLHFSLNKLNSRAKKQEENEGWTDFRKKLFHLFAFFFPAFFHP